MHMCACMYVCMDGLVHIQISLYARTISYKSEYAFAKFSWYRVHTVHVIISIHIPAIQLPASFLDWPLSHKDRYHQTGQCSNRKICIANNN